MCVGADLGLPADSEFTTCRYSLVITPVNYSLAAVNLFVGSTGLAQLFRVWNYRRQHPVQAAISDKKE